MGGFLDFEESVRPYKLHNENAMMVVGDDPWHDFRSVVLKIHYSLKTKCRMRMIDNKSCLEQAALINHQLMMEASKSSSVSQPDYSPTVTRV